ncbi:MAG TPA: twin-arginine translocation signal domain-containing protein [Candidatus Binatia bacterium]|jgi:hypothetical protein|nr:twin-arginine translocation signal domain-containing protein [Candidatus Binatia bacterium]
MEITRRDFLKLSSLASVGLSLPLVACRTVPAAPGTNHPTRAWDHYFLGSSYYPE